MWIASSEICTRFRFCACFLARLFMSFWPIPLMLTSLALGNHTIISIPLNRLQTTWLNISYQSANQNQNTRNCTHISQDVICVIPSVTGLHWKPRVVMMPTVSSLMAPEVVVMAAYITTNDDSVDISATARLIVCNTTAVTNNSFAGFCVCSGYCTGTDSICVVAVSVGSLAIGTHTLEFVVVLWVCNGHCFLYSIDYSYVQWM